MDFIYLMTTKPRRKAGEVTIYHFVGKKDKI